MSTEIFPAEAERMAYLRQWRYSEFGNKPPKWWRKAWAEATTPIIDRILLATYAQSIADGLIQGTFIMRGLRR